jgi:sugar-specific transcriptional regulator TrmB
MKNVSLLKKIGLNKYQSAIYLSLMEKGAMTVAGISRASGLHRPIIYKFLPTLEEMGLLALITKGKQKHYIAQSPEHLRELLQNINIEFEQSLPELERTFVVQGKQPIVKFFYGKKGISAIFRDLVTSLDKESVYYRFTSNKD